METSLAQNVVDQFRLNRNRKILSRVSGFSRRLPEIKTIDDLISIAETRNVYRDFNTLGLWGILPQLKELQALVGMKSLKESIFYQIIYYLQGMHERPGTEDYLHTMLYGPPGVGKTTVANIIARIYRNLGILSKNGPFKTANRQDFIAAYLGQTAIKTQKFLDSCIGGVVFIDEIYSLGPKENGKDMFTSEASDILNQFLSEHRKDCAVIGAGYEEEIEQRFFPLNRGLRRRFVWIHRIDPYEPEDLAEMAVRMTKKNNWELEVEHGEIAHIIREHKALFENCGGDIEVWLTKSRITHANRVLGKPSHHKFKLTIDDLRTGFELFRKHRESQEKEKFHEMSMYL